MNKYALRTVAEFKLPNAYGQERTIRIKRNWFDLYTWRLLYHDNPAIADREHIYTENYFDDAKAARRSARRFMKRLAQ